MNFREAEKRFAELERQWAAGQISLEAYRSALKSLRIKDAYGQMWEMQEHTGRWFVFRDGRWVEPSAQQPVHKEHASGRQNPGRQSPQRPAQQIPTASKPVVQKSRNGMRIALILGLLAACVICIGLGVVGVLIYNGQIMLPQQITQLTGATPVVGPAETPAVVEVLKEVESTAVTADGTPHADSRGVALTVPPEALEEGGQVNLTASELGAEWLKEVESAVTIDTPFYSLTAAGKNDSNGSLALSFPAASPQARILAVIDNEYLVELAQTPQDGKITLQTRAGPADPSELQIPEGYDGSGSIHYAVITPKAGARSVPSDAMVALRSAQPDERNCLPDISVIGGASLNLCRQNASGTIQVMVPNTKRDLIPQADMMVEKIEAVMNKYAGLGFTTAQLSRSSPMLVRVSEKIKNPSYYPLNGVLYIPVDSVQRIATLTPTDVYHEMAHWIQAVKYSTQLAYWSEERTWWLETSAENMVMLVEPSYVGGNLSTYGTISTEKNTLAFQESPYQWPGDYYVHAQLLKVNMCDSPSCPLSQASFAKAISEGSYPLMNGSAKGLISSNLKDYAYYLLGKMPVGTNTAIPLSGPVKSGEGYGEYVRITRNSDVDIRYDHNGIEPQMRMESSDGKETLRIEASIQDDGVYPLMVEGGAGKNPGLPVEMIIDPGASFYYTLDDGEFQYSDGSQEVKLLPIHGEMGIHKVRIVALGENGGEVFKARIQPLNLEGAWVVMPSGPKTGGGMTCSGDSDDMEDPDGTASLMAYLLGITSGTGDMVADPTGRNLDWSAV